jgi:hypothetical protein
MAVKFAFSQAGPGSNVQSAPAPEFCAMVGGSIVQLRLCSAAYIVPAAPSPGTPASRIVANSSCACRPCSETFFAPKVRSHRKVVMSTFPARHTIASDFTTTFRHFAVFIGFPFNSAANAARSVSPTIGEPPPTIAPSASAVWLPTEAAEADPAVNPTAAVAAASNILMFFPNPFRLYICLPPGKHARPLGCVWRMPHVDHDQEPSQRASTLNQLSSSQLNKYSLAIYSRFVISQLARAIISELLDQLCNLNRRIEKLDAKMVAICRTNPAVYGSQSRPTLGRSVIATAVVAAINDGR